MVESRSVELILADEEQTLVCGKSLAAALQGEGGAIVFLTGPLGAGKTTFSRGLIQAMGHDGRVKSPTYTLVEPYEMLSPAVYHFDLYRLRDPEELEFMGIRDYFQSSVVCLVEWPEKGGALLPEPDLYLRLRPEGAGRIISLQASTKRGKCLLQRLQQDASLELMGNRTC